MSDKPTEDQPVPDAVNRQVPKKRPDGDAAHRPGPGQADDREGQTREPGYDEA
ncbi:hypothetical protein ABMY26_29265 [Azospirillum sp. HJ39]|uniref:hypothetical protein n=1 Tax=Azospirillum sp. HJ39 TaxID=3159496 RepID=UPI003557B117